MKFAFRKIFFSRAASSNKIRSGIIRGARQDLSREFSGNVYAKNSMCIIANNPTCSLHSEKYSSLGLKHLPLVIRSRVELSEVPGKTFQGNLVETFMLKM
jgi:hypothetical protein